MSPRILVVGSGPSAMGAVWGLVKRAIHPEIWDIGESLPPENEILKEGLFLIHTFFLTTINHHLLCILLQKILFFC